VTKTTCNKSKRRIGKKKLLHLELCNVIIANKLRKTKRIFMITEFNIYVALALALGLLTLSVRLGVALYQS